MLLNTLSLPPSVATRHSSTSSSLSSAATSLTSSEAAGLALLTRDISEDATVFLDASALVAAADTALTAENTAADVHAAAAECGLGLGGVAHKLDGGLLEPLVRVGDEQEAVEEAGHGGGPVAQILLTNHTPF